MPIAPVPIGPVLAQAATEVTRRPKWLSAPEPWVIFLAFLGAALIAVFFYVREAGGLSFGKRAVLAGLRFLAFLAVLLLLGEIVETTTREEKRETWVVLMIDESVSMTLRDKFANRETVAALAEATGLTEAEVDDASRLDLVKRALGQGDHAVLRGLAAANRLKVVSFATHPEPVAELAPGAGGGAGGGIAPGDAARIAAIEATGGKTAIGDALNKVINETRGQRVAAVVLVTDGRSNSDSSEEQLPRKVARRLGKRRIPLLGVGVGNPDEPRDIALSELKAAEVVIAGDILPIQASVKSQGFEGERVEVEVRLDDALQKTEPLELEGKGKRQPIGIQIRPEKPGEYTLTVSIREREGELIGDNNRLSQRLRVVDEKIKVLYVEGYPRWEYRYLKNGLIRDRNMEARCFLLSADPDFPQESSPGIPPLTHVPGTREELAEYDVVIIGDVDPQDPQMGDERLKLIREFVEEGGGLLMIAGEQSAPAKYAGTPVEAVLPVAVEPSDDVFGEGGTRRRVLDTPFRPKLTIDGRKHPIMQLENVAERNLELWEARGDYAQGLPGFYWYYKVKSKKPTAEVLAEHPTDTMGGQDKPAPIIALILSGAGTSLFAAVDETWRWRAGVGDFYFYRFWGQALRFLSTGRLLKTKLTLATDKAVYDLGEKITITVEVNDPVLKERSGETQVVTIERPGEPVETLELRRPLNQVGRFEGTRAADLVGPWKVWIGPAPAADRPGPSSTADEQIATRIFQVQLPVPEKTDPRMDEKLLREMANDNEEEIQAAEGGEGEPGPGFYVPLEKIAEVPAAVRPPGEEATKVHESERSLWDRWWVLVAIVGLVSVEWVLRRAWKLL